MMRNNHIHLPVNGGVTHGRGQARIVVAPTLFAPFHGSGDNPYQSGGPL